MCANKIYIVLTANQESRPKHISNSVVYEVSFSRHRSWNTKLCITEQPAENAAHSGDTEDTVDSDGPRNSGDTEGTVDSFPFSSCRLKRRGAVESARGTARSKYISGVDSLPNSAHLPEPRFDRAGG